MIICYSQIVIGMLQSKYTATVGFHNSVFEVLQRTIYKNVHLAVYDNKKLKY